MAVPARRCRAVPAVLGAVRPGEQPERDDLVPGAAGLYRRVCSGTSLSRLRWTATRYRCRKTPVASPMALLAARLRRHVRRAFLQAGFATLGDMSSRAEAPAKLPMATILTKTRIAVVTLLPDYRPAEFAISAPAPRRRERQERCAAAKQGRAEHRGTARDEVAGRAHVWLAVPVAKASFIAERVIGKSQAIMVAEIAKALWSRVPIVVARRAI